MEHKYIIYKICNDEYPEYIYIGSTCNFIRRKCEHKIRCKNSHLKVYQIIRENGGWENWRMIPIEECGNITKTQAHIREEQLRADHFGNLNVYKAYRSKEDINETQKEYREKNKEIINKKNKDYKEKNKEIINKKNKDYKEKNKEKINEKNKEKVTCECGCEVRRAEITRHKKTKKHIKLVEANK